MVTKNSEAPIATNNQGLVASNLSRATDMKSIANNQLQFHNTNFNYMEMSGQIWLTASEIGQALKYSDDKAVQRIYSRHSDEFTENMSGVVKMTTPKGMQESRVFSLRGAHLIAMFARTPKAKEFRRWVLDILDREVAHSPIVKQFSEEEVVKLCYMQLWMEKAQRVGKEIYPAMKHFRSEFSGFFYDLGHETRFFTGETREALLREADSLDKNNWHVEKAEGMFKKLRGTKEFH